MLDQSPEPVSPENLHQTEKAEKPQPLVKQGSVYFPGIWFNGGEICSDKVGLYVFGICRPDLPYERDKVIVYGPPSSSLKINEIWNTVLDHHISGLEIAVKESVNGKARTGYATRATVPAGDKVARKSLEIIFEGYFIELQPGRLQKTIFEIVQIEHHRLKVEFLHRMAHRPVQIRPALELETGKQPDTIAKQREQGIEITFLAG